MKCVQHLGGRAAEKVIFNEISTGALSDLEKVTKQARAMVTIYGLNEKVGNLTYYDSTGQEYGFTKPYSEDTARVIDEEISNIIELQYQRAIQILEDNKEKLTTLAEQLLKREVIFQDDLEKIFGKRPHELTLTEVATVEENESKDPNSDSSAPTE
jgi:cell division protease FtsH